MLVNLSVDPPATAVIMYLDIAVYVYKTEEVWPDSEREPGASSSCPGQDPEPLRAARPQLDMSQSRRTHGFP